MEKKSTAEAADPQPRRLTRVECARLEALKSFGCEDFASVLQSAKKVSLQSKLSNSKQNNNEDKEESSKPSRQRTLSQKEKSLQRYRLTRAELGVLESLKGFENNSLADITNSSKRIVSKFLNKPKVSATKEQATTEVSSIPGGNENICEQNNPAQEINNQSVMNNRSLLSLKVDKDALHTRHVRKVKSTPSKHLKHILEVNRKVLDTAKKLDQ